MQVCTQCHKPFETKGTSKVQLNANPVLDFKFKKTIATLQEYIKEAVKAVNTYSSFK